MALQGTAFERLKSLAPTVSVGLLTADLLHLGDEIALLESAGVQVVHFDVMDGCFCPGLTVGPPFIKAVRTAMLKDVHLMIDDPLPKLDAYVTAGADIVTVSIEGGRHPHRIFQALGTMQNSNDPARGIVRGACLNPGTPVACLEPLIAELEMIVILAVNPGWSGQRFIASTEGRVGQVRQLCRAVKRDCIICVDGGVKLDNVGAVAAMGADLVVTGSAVFSGKQAAANARTMLERVKSNVR